MYKNILVVVDYQRDFVSPQGALYVPGAENVAERIQREIDNTEYDAVIYTMDTHIAEDYVTSPEGEMFPIHCEFNTPGWELFDIKPRNRAVKISIEEGLFEDPQDFSVEDEFVFVKDVFSVWEGNNRYADWIATNTDNDTVVTVVGVAENYCVFMNAMGYKADTVKEVRIIKDAVKGIPDDSYDKNVNVMKNRGIQYI